VKVSSPTSLSGADVVRVRPVVDCFAALVCPDIPIFVDADPVLRASPELILDLVDLLPIKPLVFIYWFGSRRYVIRLLLAVWLRARLLAI
jgi:hypothetical protein